MTETIAPEEFISFVAIPELRADPFPFYDRLRSLDPVHSIPLGEAGAFVVSSYDGVAQILRDGVRFSSDERNSSASALDSGFSETPFSRVAQSMLLFRDDPDHKRLRDLVQKAFTRRVVEDLRPRIAALVDELLAPIVAAGETDLVSEFAYPLPVIVICELLGVPPSDRHWFHDWARDFANRFELQPLRTPEMEERGDVATATLVEYFDGLIERKRREPANDLISALAAVEDDGDRLTHDELLSTCLLILLAGHETTANLICNGVFALLRHRDQWDRLASDPSLTRSAVEELLRYDSPVQIIQRIALEDVDVSGRTIKAGAFIGLLLAAANRDPEHFSEPDRLDITRGDAPLVAFGGGVHFCLGAPLARLETQLALRALAERMPDLRLREEPRWRGSFVLRGLESLRVGVGEPS